MALHDYLPLCYMYITHSGAFLYFTCNLSSAYWLVNCHYLSYVLSYAISTKSGARQIIQIRAISYHSFLTPCLHFRGKPIVVVID